MQGGHGGGQLVGILSCGGCSVEEKELLRRRSCGREEGAAEEILPPRSILAGVTPGCQGSERVALLRSGCRLPETWRRTVKKETVGRTKGRNPWEGGNKNRK
jgi:hypothetical protein